VSEKHRSLPEKDEKTFFSVVNNVRDHLRSWTTSHERNLFLWSAMCCLKVWKQRNNREFLSQDNWFVVRKSELGLAKKWPIIIVFQVIAKWKCDFDWFVQRRVAK
jgi:hypothetical protein